ncbi:MAG: FecR domain-containing protein [Polyangiaceae bacterium]|nr:FecR domain-containing protein [Polyangiaceae bacterium]
MTIKTLNCGRAMRLYLNSQSRSNADQESLAKHLEGCAACRQEVLLTQAFRASHARRDAIVGLKANAQERAISAALEEASTTEAAHHSEAAKSSKYGGARVLAAAVVLAAVAALVVRVAWPGSEPSTFQLSPAAPAVLKFAQAEVRALSPAEASWNSEDATLHLKSGSISVSVDPKPHKKFRVLTPRFSVEVTGTRFVVTSDSVSVTEGHVRIRAVDGTVLAEQLAAGGRWSLNGTEEKSPPPLSPTQATISTTARPNEATSLQTPGASAPTPDEMDAWLKAAARFIADGNAGQARKLLERVLAAAPTGAEKARAQLLLGDCARLDGNAVGASEHYRQSSRTATDPSEGDVALFSAAVAAADAKDRVRAKTLFQSYLTRYPKGTLRREAKLRLAELQAE